MNWTPLPYNVVIHWCYCYHITATTVHLNSQEHRQRCFADKNNAFRSADVEQLAHEAVTKYRLQLGMAMCSVCKSCKSRVFKEKFP